MAIYHGIIVKESFKKQSVLNLLKTIGSKQGKNFSLLKIEVSTEEITKTIVLIQKSLKEKFYAHLYRDDELMVIFPNKIFFIKPDRKTWEEAVDYGKSIGIPEEQLDFRPCRFEDEIY